MPSMAVSDELRRFLREQREEHGVNQDEFNEPGYAVSRTTVQSIERGTTTSVRAHTLVSMCVNLDITPEELTANNFTQLARALARALRQGDTYTAAYRRTMRRSGAEGDQ